MKPMSVTPLAVRALAGQVGFTRFDIVDGNVVHCVLYHRGRPLTQIVGRVTDVQKLLDFCRKEGIAIDDDRTPCTPAWADDPWVVYGA